MKMPRGPEGETVVIEDVELVKLKIWFADRQTVSDFFAWLAEQEIYSSQGLMSGAGWHIALWSPDDAVRVREWVGAR